MAMRPAGKRRREGGDDGRHAIRQQVALGKGSALQDANARGM